VTDFPTYPLTVEGIRKAVASLDVDDSYDLAARLQGAGAKGVIGSECNCPIAVRLRQLIPGASQVFVEAETVRVEGSERDTFGFDMPVVVSVTLPDGAQDFIQEFDRGEWPELIESTEEAPDVDPAA
jgi:hypothetical protein